MNGRPTVVVYLPDLSGGGAERLHILLGGALEDRGFNLTFLLDRRTGALLDQVPQDKIIALNASRQLKAFSKLVRYLKTARPDYMISNMEHMNVTAIVARWIAGVPTRVIVTQHNAFSRQIDRPSLKYRLLPSLYRLALPFADKIVAVSYGVAHELAGMLKLPLSRVEVIHNGVSADSSGDDLSPHPWFDAEDPVIIAMGRMVDQKDFFTLIRAFAKVRATHGARLIILGDGPDRSALQAEAVRLGVDGFVAMPGFQAHPAAWLRRANMFVLSSKFEGFGNVLVEALLCGTPVVSTDCPFGPSEILDDGRFGQLVPVGDADGMADAIVRTLATPRDPARLKARGESFSVDNCADKYAAMMRSTGERADV